MPPLVVPEIGALEFFSPERLYEGLATCGFGVIQEMDILTSIAMDANENSFVRLSALRQLNQRLKESFVLSGQVREHSAIKTLPSPDGGKLLGQSRAFQLLSSAARGAAGHMENNDGRDAPLDSGDQGLIDEDGTQHSGIGEVREGHFPPTYTSGGVAKTGPGNYDDALGDTGAGGEVPDRSSERPRLAVSCDVRPDGPGGVDDDPEGDSGRDQIEGGGEDRGPGLVSEAGEAAVEV